MPRKAYKPPNPVFEIVMETDAVIRGELYPSAAPQTVGNFIRLANKGFYDGLTFHRCIREYLAQAGKPQEKELSYCITGEFEFNRFKGNKLPHEYASLCMSRGGHYDSANSQFYIVVSTDERELACLNGAYAVFGKVLEGMKVVEAIAAVQTDAHACPVHPQRIRRIRVETFDVKYPFVKLKPPKSNINQPKIKHRIPKTTDA